MRAGPILRGTGLACAAVAVALGSSSGVGRDADVRAFARVNAGSGPFADRAYVSITEMGSLWASGAAAAALAMAGRRRPAAMAAGAAAVTWLAGQGLKRVFLRPRPSETNPENTRLLIAKPHGTSWPSSHPAVLIAFLTVAGRELRLGGPARAALSALGNAVGVSRVYVGVHYPSDVTGGLLLGRAVAELFGAAG